ncbi:FxsA family protein [Rhodocista pekingensis]|uniref:FxsA family protein n=1 Tax=Rhodocista pekingensis TaxID=201185 RepID=A0ABW2KSY7_9PROT
MRFLLFFLLLPLAEIAGFAWVGSAIGVLPTVLLVVLSALVGIGLLKRHGIDTLRRAQDRLDRGEPPVQEAFDGLCLALAGLLLVIPGFLSDIAGLLLFLPPVRSWLFGRMNMVVVTTGPAGMRPGGPLDGAGRPGGRAHGGPDVIEGDWVEVREERYRLEGEGGDDTPPTESRWRPPGR